MLTTIPVLVLLTHSVESNAEKTARCIKQGAKHGVKRFAGLSAHKIPFTYRSAPADIQFIKKRSEERFFEGGSGTQPSDSNRPT